ncbi:VOC family protein [Halorubrum sp. AD140]|uniref:VOC family protein n=1 Tax=Halorubrum sp. AD140 TaxID=3050073 RepID=UPI002ACC74AC|nr:VOC family protein [Halorubrum sp. AD140]MDZ5810013.1 VOC family protein [Halorubrum sp. AD140]
MTRESTVSGVDHVELFVTDWDDAASWYERVLGITPDASFEEWWATGSGPLMLSVDDATKLALFERESAVRGHEVSPTRIAFRTDADGFVSFLDRLDTLELTGHDGDPVTPDDVVDHELSYSVYFTDPDGNLLELTTNDYDEATSRLN